MKKFLIFLISLFLFSAFIIPSRSHAAITCSVTTDPAIVTSDDISIKTVTLQAKGVDANKSYRIKVTGQGYAFATWEIWNQKFTDGKIVFSNVDTNGVPGSSTGGNNFTNVSYGIMPGKTFYPGIYTYEIIDVGEWSLTTFLTQPQQICKTSFSVEKGSGNKCNMVFPDAKIDESTDLKMQLTDIDDPKAEYVTYVQKDSDKGKGVAGFPMCRTAAEYADPTGVSLGIFPKGVYYISIYKAPLSGCGTIATTFTSFLTSYFSSTRFNIPKSCSGIAIVPGFAIGSNTVNSATLSGFLTFTGTIGSPCKNIGTSSKPNFKCPTAIGDIETSPTAFAKRIFGILLSLSGGIALLLIINAGYQIMVSEGNPEKIQGARETITSAIIGLVFIIFSLTILQIIGVDILRIPGFTR